AAPPSSSGAPRSSLGCWRSSRFSATSWRSWCPQPQRGACARSPSGMPGCARSRSDGPMSRKLVLVVIDGLTPTMLETSLDTSATPTLTALAEAGTLGRATTTFPSLTPVCLSSIATGAHPDVHHLGRGGVTFFEALADAGRRTAALNFTAYRGRTRHRPTVPFFEIVLGPERFFFYNLFQSERTGAPLSFRNRAAGSIDSYAAAVGRWLVNRDGFD